MHTELQNPFFPLICLGYLPHLHNLYHLYVINLVLSLNIYGRDRTDRKTCTTLLLLCIQIRDTAVPHCMSREHLICTLYALDALTLPPCPSFNPNPAVIYKPSEWHHPNLQRMGALIAGCFPFLHLEQVHSCGNWQQCIMDTYLLQRVISPNV